MQLSHHQTSQLFNMNVDHEAGRDMQLITCWYLCFLHHAHLDILSNKENGFYAGLLIISEGVFVWLQRQKSIMLSGKELCLSWCLYMQMREENKQISTVLKPMNWSSMWMLACSLSCFTFCKCFDLLQITSKRSCHGQVEIIRYAFLQSENNIVNNALTKLLANYVTELKALSCHTVKTTCIWMMMAHFLTAAKPSDCQNYAWHLWIILANWCQRSSLPILLYSDLRCSSKKTAKTWKKKIT